MAFTAIFGGTFNPFHIGHYQMLSALCSAPFVKRVLVMPDKIPPHKVCDFMAKDTDRIEMCRIACEDFDKAQLCLVEFEREGKSYTVDTVKRLREMYPDERFAVACGGDMIATLDEWRDYKTLFGLTAFVAFKREGLEGFEESVRKMRSLGADITVIDAEITEISSSLLRRNMDNSMLPEKVAVYITEKGVYNDNTNT